MCETGRLVRSRCGRDGNGYFVVVGCDGGYLYICDGKRRPLERPKKKSVRHVELTSISIPEESRKTNRLLRRALREYSSTHNADQGGC